MTFVSKLLNKLAGAQGINLLNWRDKVAYEPVELKEPVENKSQAGLYWQSVEYFKRVNAQNNYIRVLVKVIGESETKLEEIDKLIEEKEREHGVAIQSKLDEIAALKKELHLSEKEVKEKSRRIVDLLDKHTKMNTNNQKLSSELMQFKKRKIFNDEIN